MSRRPIYRTTQWDPHLRNRWVCLQLFCFTPFLFYVNEAIIINALTVLKWIRIDNAQLEGCSDPLSNGDASHLSRSKAHILSLGLHYFSLRTAFFRSKARIFLGVKGPHSFFWRPAYFLLKLRILSLEGPHSRDGPQKPIYSKEKQKWRLDSTLSLFSNESPLAASLTLWRTKDLTDFVVDESLMYIVLPSPL